MMTTPAPRSHRNNIDALRLILAFVVLFSHSYPLATGSEEFEPLAWASGGQATLGGLAVDWFFVLSGFLITQSWERSRTLWSFLRKRVARIYPGYLAAVLFCLVVVVPAAHPEGFRAITPSVLSQIAGPILALRGLEVPGTFPTNPTPGAINGSLWSISYEAWCYVGVAALGLTTLLRHRRLVLVLFGLSLAISFAFAYLRLTPGGKILGVIFGFPPFWARLLPFYLSGVVAYLFRDRLGYGRVGAALAVAGLAIGARLPHAYSILLPTLGTYLVLYLAFTNDWQWHDAAARGDFSYGIYLYAFPIQQWIMLRFGRPVSPWLLFALASGPALAAGILSWALVERHFLGRRRIADTERHGVAPPATDAPAPLVGVPVLASAPRSDDAPSHR